MKVKGFNFFSNWKKSNSSSKYKIHELEEKIGVHFRNKEILYHAMTHRSAVGSKRELSNERLEYLGDSILGMLVSEYLFTSFPNRKEGELTELKSLLVSQGVISRVAKALELGHYIQMSEAESHSGGRNRENILADTFEALISAIYLDRGMKAVREFINCNIFEKMDELLSSVEKINYKGILQRETQEKGLGFPTYMLYSSLGPEHKKTFEVEVYINSKKYGKGIGKTRKEAEQRAAGMGLRELRKELGVSSF